VITYRMPIEITVQTDQLLDAAKVLNELELV
jgi:hypothetical protein